MSVRCWTISEALKDVVFRKYQRRRASAEDVASIEKLLSERAAHE